MSTIAGDAFRMMAEESKARRASNRERSAAELTARGIAFVSKNHGTHLILAEWELFPGTGLWKHRKTKEKGRGVFNLIRRLETKP